jgi:histone H3/H4
MEIKNSTAKRSHGGDDLTTISGKRRKFRRRKNSKNPQTEVIDLTSTSTTTDPLIFEEDVEIEFLPIHNIKQIVRSCLPETDPLTGRKIRVTKNFYLLLSDILAEFIHIICTKLFISLNIGDKGTTTVISDEDILTAMESLGINQYSVFLRLFMSDYREMAYNVMMKRLGLVGGGDGLLAIDWNEQKAESDPCSITDDPIESTAYVFRE